VPTAFDRAAVAALISASREALAGIGALVEARRQAGKVRLCHGDLHLRNICLLDGVPTLFDCIEFSRDLACIDVLYDLSFLLMDLVHRQLPELGNTVFNRYFDLEGEAEGAAALPLYLSLHAAIRAHVGAAALLAKRPEQREESVAEARAYLDLAQTLLRPAKPRLIAIGGFSGTGKSTLAYGLAPRLGAPPGARVLRSDVLRKRVMGRAPESLAGRGLWRGRNRWSMAGSARRPAAAERRLQRHPRCGLPAAGGAGRGGSAGARSPGRFSGPLARAKPRSWRGGSRGRRGDASDATVEILRRQLAFPTGPIAWHRVDVGGTPAVALAAVSKMIG
jgi:predicted kinase